MQRANSQDKKISEQVKAHLDRPHIEPPEYAGDASKIISTGSTLLDLAISGGRIRGGGIPTGIMVEIFGPPGSGKTVVLCEIGGAIQRQGGQVLFNDPEARLNEQFAKMFDISIEDLDYEMPDTVTEVFKQIAKWDPKPDGLVHGIMTDSLAALSTNLEMTNPEGDKMGMRRAKEFSEGFRKTCRILKDKSLLMVCSNQVRENSSDGYGAPKYISPGGMAIGFYSSLRLRCSSPTKIKRVMKGKTLSKGASAKEKKQLVKVIGVETEIEIYKSSVWEPYHTAPLVILFDYGIDDVRANLQYIKDITGASTYSLGGESLSNKLEDAIAMIEDDNRDGELREEVIDLWEDVESKFRIARKKKMRKGMLFSGIPAKEK